MPRLVNVTPKYRKHKASGQALVTLDGTDFYLGPYGTRASRIKYDRRVGEWIQNGRRLPTTSGAVLDVVELCDAYWAHAKSYYVKDGRMTDEVDCIKTALRFVTTNYADVPVTEFGPLALKNVRQKMIDAGLSRGYINKTVGRIRRMFRWGVANEFVPSSIHQALLAVPGLSKGRSEARETTPIPPVAPQTVDATLTELSPVVADMVRFQRLTGCRPGEVCAIRPRDVTRTGDVWEYRPEGHKMAHTGRERIVWIGPKAQAVITPYLVREPDAYCFVTTRGNHGRYTKESYRAVIRSAAERAKATPWNPNQLRHLAATEIRREYGLEAAQVILGHAQANVTQVYAERDAERAKKVMLAIG